MCGLLGAATFVRQGSKKQGYSEDDGWGILIPLFDNYADVARQSSLTRAARISPAPIVPTDAAPEQDVSIMLALRKKPASELPSARRICLYGRIHGQAGRAKLLLPMHRPPLDHGSSDLIPQRRRKVGDRDPDHVAIAGGIAEPLRRTEIKTKAPSMAQRQSSLSQVAAQIRRHLLRLLLV